MVPAAGCLQPRMRCLGAKNCNLHAVDGLYSTRACMYDDVHCMEAELGAVKGQRRAKVGGVGYWYRVHWCVLVVSGASTNTSTHRQGPASVDC